MTIHYMEHYRSKRPSKPRVLDASLLPLPDSLLEKIQANSRKTPEEREEDDLRWAKQRALEMITGSIELACCQRCRLATGKGGLGVLIDCTIPERPGRYADQSWRVECSGCKMSTAAGFTFGEAAYYWNLHNMHRLKLEFR